uniref:Uncharacterized protein n=1 Tax=Rhizophora mucronata TaxID=61149 RepID=A0A2P2IIZ3_RHIMU
MGDRMYHIQTDLMKRLNLIKVGTFNWLLLTVQMS